MLTFLLLSIASTSAALAGVDTRTDVADLTADAAIVGWAERYEPYRDDAVTLFSLANSPTADRAVRYAAIAAAIEVGRFDVAGRTLEQEWATLIDEPRATRAEWAPVHWLLTGRLRRQASRFEYDLPAAASRAVLEPLKLAAEHPHTRLHAEIETAAFHLDRHLRSSEHSDTALADAHALAADWTATERQGIEARRVCIAIAHLRGWRTALEEEVAATLDANPDALTRALALHARASSDVTLAGPALRESVEALDVWRAGLDDARGDAAAVRRVQFIYDAWIQHLVESNQRAAALLAVERARPRFHGRPPQLALDRPTDVPVLVLHHGSDDRQLHAWRYVNVDGASPVIEYASGHLDPVTLDAALAPDSPKRLDAIRAISKTLAPLLDDLEAKRVSVAATGTLRQLPFDLLDVGPPARPQLWVERFAWTHVPGLCVVEGDPLRRGPATPVIARPILALLDPTTHYEEEDRPVRPPLPAALREGVIGFATVAAPGSRVLTGRDASAAALARHGANSGIVHIAAHGEFDSTHPWRSSLYLAGLGEDGRLYAEQLRALDLSGVQLLVLSGCETGVGPGLAGLPRAALESGAEQLIATLRPIEDDAAARLMVRFYEHLGTGVSVAQALQRAKLDEFSAARLGPRREGTAIAEGPGPVRRGPDRRPRLASDSWSAWALFSTLSTDEATER